MDEEITSVSSMDQDDENNEAITIDQKMAKMERKREQAEKDPLDDSQTDDFSEDHWAGDRNRGRIPDSEKKNYRKGKQAKKKKRVEDMDQFEKWNHEGEQEGQSEEEKFEGDEEALIKDEEPDDDPFAKLDELQDEQQVQEQKKNTLEDIHNRLMTQTLDTGHKGEQDAMDAWAKEHTTAVPANAEPANRKGVDIDPTFRGFMDVVSLDNEEGAWRVIEDAVDATLAKYPTTLDEDREILDEDKTENTLGKNKTNCILFRMSEKMVLLQIKDWADKVM